MVAISFALFVMGLIALVANLATIYGADATASRAAQDAAIAGSADIDLPTFLNPALGPPGALHGPLKLLPGAASLCRGVGDTEAGPGTTSCSLSAGNRDITATVTIPVDLPLPFVSASVTIVRTYKAAPQAGTLNPIP